MGKVSILHSVSAVLYIRVLGNDTEGRRGGIQLSSREYHVTVNESISAGTRLLTLSARSTSGGSHLGRGIFYNIIVGNDDNCFTVNTSTGKP